MPSAQLCVVYVLCACLMGGVWMQRMASQAEAQRERGPAKITRKAPTLRLEAEGGQAFSLEPYRGRWRMINFWATWCEPCRREMPALERLARSFPQEKLPIVLLAVSVDQEWSLIHDFLRKHPFFRGTSLSMRIVRDAGGVMALRYGTQKFPETYLIDPNGRLRAKWVGALEWDSPQILAQLRRLVGRAQ
ncbi:TlpA family protein disulfide reductase [Myxococcota bacterium]|nr:TlpA family protein disulfide reductase [Myxococcota bacterium]